MSRQIIKAFGAVLPGKVAEPPQDGNTPVDVAGGIALLLEPLTVALDGLADPRGSETIDGVGL